MIEEIKFKDFPWEDMPWARASPNQNKLKTSGTDPEDPVLILWKNYKRVAYLYCHIFDVANIMYVETHPDFVKLGYATELLNEVCRRYHGDLDISAQPTCLEAKRLLERCGFERVSKESLYWVLRKKK